MGKNFYEILGISSPAMLKHFKKTDETIKELKETTEITKKLSSAMLVTEDTLSDMTVEKLEEMVLTKPIMFIDSSFNNCINLMWLSTIKKGINVAGESAIRLIFENDYMYAELTKFVNSGDITSYQPYLKEHHTIKQVLISKSDFTAIQLAGSTGSLVTCYQTKIAVENVRNHIYRLGTWNGNSGNGSENVLENVYTSVDKWVSGQYQIYLEISNDGENVVITIPKVDYDEILDLYSLYLTIL